MVKQIFIFCFILFSVEGFAQGKITRPTRVPQNSSQRNMQQRNKGQEQQQQQIKQADKNGEQSNVLLPEQKNTGTINGHQWVDLGLPSGVKWATCNIGAFSPSEYGRCHSWGELVKKSEYNLNNCKTINNYIIGDISGNIQYDVARAHWGDSWRLPTYIEMEELVKKCNWTWTTQNGSNGYQVTGSNGKSIFLPTAGYYIGSSHEVVGKEGRYWTSTPYDIDAQFAYALKFYDKSSEPVVLWLYRYLGCYIRPVTN